MKKAHIFLKKVFEQGGFDDFHICHEYLLLCVCLVS